MIGSTVSEEVRTGSCAKIVLEKPNAHRDKMFSYKRFGKRIVDLLLILVSSPVTLPVIFILYLRVGKDGGDGFFGHTRVGQGGREFKCWKIRTMVPDAEAALVKYLSENPHEREAWSRDFKLKNDPRITRIGKFLRRSSLDELPQLWNILKGEMSFVGPRPVTCAELPMYGDDLGFYYAVKPGLTGPWQVGGRNDVSYEERVALDKQYCSELGLLTDIKLILATTVVVLKRTGV